MAKLYSFATLLILLSFSMILPTAILPTSGISLDAIQIDFGEPISKITSLSLIKDTPEKAFRYADEMLYADKLSKKRRNCSAENI